MRHREHGCVYADIDLAIGWLSRDGDTRRSSVQSYNRRATGEEALPKNAQRGGLPELHRLGHAGVDRAGGIAGRDVRAAQCWLGVGNNRHVWTGGWTGDLQRLHVHLLEYIAGIQAQIAERVAPGISC